jgi:hypothetical protein
MRLAAAGVAVRVGHAIGRVLACSLRPAGIGRAAWMHAGVRFVK